MCVLKVSTRDWLLQKGVLFSGQRPKHHMLGRSDAGRALYRCGCSSERHRVGFGEKAVDKHVRLVLASGGGGERRSD